MKFENIKVYNFEGALRGMRNPKNSWHLSDSVFGLIDMEWDESDYAVAEKWAGEGATPEQIEEYDKWLIKNGILDASYDTDTAQIAFIGPKDMKLAKQLIKGGSEHRKFLRQIMVSVDITAPIFWWKEFDTYKVGTTANSTSTMHKLTSKPITMDCFETGDMEEYCLFMSRAIGDEGLSADDCETLVARFIDFLEGLRVAYCETKDKRYWKELVRWLPESWLQTRTVTMNYENLLSMCHQREHHKLIEWSLNDNSEELDSFLKFAHSLPYADDFIFCE